MKLKQFSFLGKNFLLFIQIEIYTYFNIIRFYAWNNKFYILRQIENYESSQLFVRLHISSERRIKTPLDVIVVNKISFYTFQAHIFTDPIVAQRHIFIPNETTNLCVFEMILIVRRRHVSFIQLDERVNGFQVKFCIENP